MRERFKPEFLNRVDETIFFKALTLQQLSAIVDIQMEHLRLLLKEHNITFDITDDAKELLATRGFNPIYGARPLKRFVQKKLETLIAKKILTGEILPMAEKFELAKVFTANSALFKTDKILCEAIDYSVEHTKVYHEDFAEEVNVKKAGNVKLMKGRTLQTALKIGRENPGKKIAVLNFAASQNPGGGIATGSRAQEESICRSSTLYPTLTIDSLWKNYYKFLRRL